MGLGMRIMTNLSGIQAHRQLNITNARVNKTMEKLSSGYRINRAADDAAGLAVSEKFRTQIRGLEQAGKNTQDGISMIQTAEGGLIELTDMLQRMRVLAIQASNDTLTTSDRALIQLEIDQLLAEIDRMQTSVEFNTKPLLTGIYAEGGQETINNQSVDRGSLSFHVGANKAQKLAVQIQSFSASSLGINVLQSGEGSALTSIAGANSAIQLLSDAINQVSSQRAVLGAFQNRLESTFNFINITRENQIASESRIRDADIAMEMVNFTKDQILAQAGNAMLVQSNFKNQSVLQLFG
jgi:flagellin